jgi:DNA-binding PadR family transcriptional regulator
MSLPHALLTALLERSCSGSELAGRFERSIGFFWHATHQQIYRELARLEEAGWVEALPPESGRGRKRVYRMLPAGRKELKRWAAESHDARPLREELMVRLRAEAVVGPTGVERDIARRLEQHRKRLALYRELEARDFSAAKPSRETQVQHLILQAGIMMEALWVQWSEQALKVLKR